MRGRAGGRGGVAPYLLAAAGLILVFVAVCGLVDLFRVTLAQHELGRAVGHATKRAAALDDAAAARALFLALVQYNLDLDADLQPGTDHALLAGPLSVTLQHSDGDLHVTARAPVRLYFLGALAPVVTLQVSHPPAAAAEMQR